MPTVHDNSGPCNEVRYGAVLLLRLNPDYVSFLNITHTFGFKLHGTSKGETKKKHVPGTRCEFAIVVFCVAQQIFHSS